MVQVYGRDMPTPGAVNRGEESDSREPQPGQPRTRRQGPETGLGERQDERQRQAYSKAIAGSNGRFPWRRERQIERQAEQESAQEDCSISSIIPNSVKAGPEKVNRKLHRTMGSIQTPTRKGEPPQKTMKITGGYVSQLTVIKAFIVKKLAIYLQFTCNLLAIYSQAETPTG